MFVPLLFCTAVAVVPALRPTPGWLQRWGYLGVWNLPWQPGLKYTRPVFFSSRDCCTHVKCLVPLHLRIHGFQISVAREASTAPLQAAGGAERVVAPCVSCSVVPPVAGTPAQPVSPVSSYSQTPQRQVILTTSQERYSSVKWCFSCSCSGCGCSLPGHEAWKTSAAVCCRFWELARWCLWAPGATSRCLRGVCDHVGHAHLPGTCSLCIYGRCSYGHPYTIKAFLRREEMSWAE